MAGKAQTRPGEAVYRLNFGLRTPRGEHRPSPIWLPAGYEAGAHELAGLVVPALEEGLIVKMIKEPEVPCEFCQAHGTGAQKKERYSSAAAMAAHYQEAHPGVRPLEEF